jgi:sugar phosphate isomerase/epimerase
VAPFTLADSVDQISPRRRRQLRETIEGEGMVCSGIHWLLVKPRGLHLATRDRTLREKSWSYLSRLIDFCADLGGHLMILGSPQQRNTRDGMTAQEALGRLAEGLSELAPAARDRDVTLLMEAVSSEETDVVSTLAEAVEVVDRVSHGHVRTMFDCHNAADEGSHFLSLVERYWSRIRHVHVNEIDGRHPGTGDVDFERLLRFLRDRNYGGWVSLEVFDFRAGGERIARESISYLREIESRLETASNH